MLISFVALVGLGNAIMLGISNFAWSIHMPGTDHGIPFPHSLNAVLGVIGAPIAWLIGIPWHEARTIGNLLGTRTIINEFLAFQQLGPLKTGPGHLDPRTFSIATFALCGFANVGSIGMQIGGIGALVPNRRNDLARLGLRAMLAGTMANLMSASIVSMLIQ
jgi:CNT family concentrative nucleoside transporter